MIKLIGVPFSLLFGFKKGPNMNRAKGYYSGT